MHTKRLLIDLSDLINSNRRVPYFNSFSIAYYNRIHSNSRGKRVKKAVEMPSKHASVSHVVFSKKNFLKPFLPIPVLRNLKFKYLMHFINKNTN